MYALSGLLKHNATAVKKFTELQGWNTLRNSLEGESDLDCLATPYISSYPVTDSDIALRRKTAFLINTLLTPTSGETSSAPASVHSPSSTNAPVHPNSHASMLSDPASVSTSPIAMEALHRETASNSSSLLDTLICALVEPVPFGADGENERDVEFQENVARLVDTLPMMCTRSCSYCMQTASHVFCIARR